MASDRLMTMDDARVFVIFVCLVTFANQFDVTRQQDANTTTQLAVGNQSSHSDHILTNKPVDEQPKVEIETNTQDVDNLEVEWDYEPRIWSYDEPKSLVSSELVDESTGDIQKRVSWSENEDLISDDGSSSLTKFEDNNDKYSSDDSTSEPPSRDPHEPHYFVGPTLAHHLKSNSATPPIGKRSEESNSEEQCNQFRVDVREAIICDKRRCDKLDFEWPKYDNQISFIQTSRDGMRFKQMDLAMTPTKHQSAGNIKISRKARSSHTDVPPDRVKIDIFDFLKPKTTTTTTTTSTTTTSKPDTTTSAPSDTTEQPSTAKPLPTTTTGKATTASPGTTTKKPADSNEDDNDEDPEAAKLITTLRLDTRRLKQKMIGFGGALSDATCRNIKSLSPQMADSLMEDYFGSRGLKYNIARLSVGSSDFSTTPYTNNDKPADVSPETIRRLVNRQLFLSNNLAYNNLTVSVATNRRLDRADLQPAIDDDLEMKNFKLVSEDHDFKLPIVRQAIATSSDRELLLFASMWSPPIWMKNNSHIVHGYLKGDVYGPYYRSLAELMVRWLEAYRQQGIEFWAFTGLNEPVTGIQPFIFHNSLGITKRDYFTFLKLYLGPMLRQRHFEKLKLLLLDDNKGFAPNYVKSAMADAQLAQLISGIAFHWYMNDEFENLDFISRDYPSKFLISTEASNGYLPFQVHTLPGDWDRGVAYMLDIMASVQHSAAAWVDWNMVLDLGGGPSWAKNNLDAAVIVNAQRDEYYKSPTFYALGHFSRFVEPGSRRLDQILSHARFDLPLEAVGFLTPNNYIVIVALNENKAPIPFKIIVNRRLIRQLSLRPQSFATIVFKAPSSS